MNSPSKTTTTNLLSLSGSNQTTPNPAPVSNTGILIDVLGDLGGESTTDSAVNQPAAPTTAPATNGLASVGGIPTSVPLLDTSSTLLGVEDKSKKLVFFQCFYF